MATNHKYDTAQSACRRFYQEAADRYHQEGLAAHPKTPCPYPRTSFAAFHWLRGAAEQRSIEP